MAGSGIKAKVLGGFLSSKGLLTGNVVELVTMKMRKKIKTIACLLRVGYTKCNRVAQCFLTLGTKLRLVLSFFTLRRDFMDLKKTLTFDEHGDKLVMGYLLQTEKNVLNGVHYYCFILWIEARCVTAVFCENRQNVVK